MRIHQTSLRLVLAILSILYLGSSGVGSAVAADGAVDAKTQMIEADEAWSETPPDVEQFVSFFAADGGFFPPGAPLATGKDAIRAVAAQLFASPGFVLNWTATGADVSSAGDLGYTIGTYNQKGQDVNGGEVRVRGKYVTVWRKQADGKWKVVADIFNDDGPASD